jgi:SOUL heme-binding protein
MAKWLIALFFALGSGLAMAIEEPSYKSLLQEDRMELRSYAPFTVAEVQVQGSFDEASRRGFRLIADYIFGNNQSITQPDRSEKIAMTAPVTVEPDPGTQGEQWRMHFVMPSSYRLQTLPKPNNSAVRLREVSEGLFAVIRFSGFTTESAIATRSEELQRWIQSKGWISTGSAQIARYNDPFTLPFNRRNEILIPVKRP